MKILSIYGSLPSTVSLIIDNKIISAVNEERYTRKKNDEVFPRHAIDYCLANSNIKGKDLDAVAVASFISPFDDNLVQKSAWTVNDYLKEQEFRWKPFLVDKTHTKLKSLLEIFPEKILLDQYPYDYWKNMSKDPERLLKHRSGRLKMISDYLNIDQSKVKAIDHHKAHAYYSYYTSNMIGKDVLSFTVDGMGDNINATISTFDKDGNWKRHYATNECGIARIYRYMTLLLGMKPNEHEYKVMGLAPYSKNNYFVKCYNDVFKNILKVENCKIVHNQRPKDLYNFLQKKLLKYRFDNIAGAVQFFVENLTNKLIKQISKKYKINHFTISGGVSMNIKMNGNILKMKEVKGLFVPPCGTDDSLSIGACYYLNKENKQEQYLKNIYLGQELNKNKLTVKTVKKFIKNKYKFKIYEDYNVKKIAKLIHQGEIIAVAQGKEEFGARALGNRSIIANPSFDGVVEKINEQIKNRDFWMPFALTILNNKHKNFIKNEKNITSDFMTIGFDTLSKNYMKIKNGTHPYDKTVRPQILRKDFNDNYYRIIKEFYKISKIPAVLNTSLNLHGLPISSTLKEVINTFLNSGLRYLFLEGKILIKKI